MSKNYFGTPCPVCNKPLNSGEDIVVCPDCGTPHHRSCYKQLGHCANEAMHNQEFAWIAPKKEIPADDAINCPKCNEVNEKHQIFCTSCGTPLHGNATEPANPFMRNPDNGASPFTTFGDVNPNQEIDGIKVKDWQTYIGNSAPFYLYQFKRMDSTGRKTGICWSALFFPEYYFLYRRVWGIGLLIFLCSNLLAIPAALSLLVDQGLLTGLSLAVLDNLAWICSTVAMCANVLWSIFATYLFRKNAAKKILKMKAESKDETEFQQKLARKSGPSRIILYIVGIILLFSLFANFMMLRGI